MKLPLHKNSSGSAKCLISLGARGQKSGKTGFGVELGRPRCSPPIAVGGVERHLKIHLRIGLHGQKLRHPLLTGLVGRDLHARRVLEGDAQLRVGVGGPGLRRSLGACGAPGHGGS